MVRIVLAATSAALLLSACGGAGGKAAVVKQCVDGGESQKTCQCIADKTEKAVDKDVWRAMVLQAQGKNAEAQKIMESLSMEKQFSAMGAAAAAFECMGNS